MSLSGQKLGAKLTNAGMPSSQSRQSCLCGQDSQRWNAVAYRKLNCGNIPPLGSIPSRAIISYNGIGRCMWSRIRATARPCHERDIPLFHDSRHRTATVRHTHTTGSDVDHALSLCGLKLLKRTSFWVFNGRCGHFRFWRQKLRSAHSIIALHEPYLDFGQFGRRCRPRIRFRVSPK